jgi:hypothetical protein
LPLKNKADISSFTKYLNISFKMISFTIILGIKAWRYYTVNQPKMHIRGLAALEEGAGCFWGSELIGTWVMDQVTVYC